MVAIHLFASRRDPWPADQPGLEGTRTAVNVANNVDRSRKELRKRAGWALVATSRGASSLDSAPAPPGLLLGAGTFCPRTALRLSPKEGGRFVKLRHVDFNFCSHDIVEHLFLRCHHHHAAEERSKPSPREGTFKGAA